MVARAALLGLSFFSILCSALTAGPQSSQGSEGTPRPQGAVTIRSTTRLVQVSVVVTDKHGEPVTGLKKEDFSVFDQGRSQDISVFSTASPASAKFNRVLPTTFFTNRFDLKGQGTGDVTIILFDALNTSDHDQAFVRRQIFHFLQALKPQDHIAIYALTTQLIVLQEFTQDASALVNAVSGFTPKELAAFDASNTPKIDVVRAGADPQWMNLQNAVNNANAEISDRNTINRAATTASAIEAIADHVAAIPGRKNLIWVSGGFPIQVGVPIIGRSDSFEMLADDSLASHVGPLSPTNKLTTGDRDTVSLEPVLNKAALALNRVNMSIYAVDARGVQLDSTMNSDARGGSVGQDSSVFSAEQNSRDSSKLLADRTGGLAFFGNNDIGDALHHAMNDGQYSYSIGFYPDHGKWDGKVHEIRIGVKLGGARLRYRRQYIAVGYRAENEKSVDSAVQEAALNPLEATTIGMIVEGKLVGPATRDVQLRVAIDPKQLLLEGTHNQQKGAIDLLFIQRDSAGKILLAEKQHLDLKLPQAQYEFLASAGMVLEHHMSIKPQAAEIRIAVRDSGSGFLGSVTIPVQTLLQVEATTTKAPTAPN